MRQATVIARIDIYDERYTDGTLENMWDGSDSDQARIDWLQENCACDPFTQDMDLEFGEILIDVPGYMVYYFDYGMNEGIELYKL